MPFNILPYPCLTHPPKSIRKPIRSILTLKMAIRQLLTPKMAIRQLWTPKMAIRQLLFVIFDAIRHIFDHNPDDWDRGMEKNFSQIFQIT